MTSDLEALQAIVDQQKAKLIERSNEIAKLEHDLRNCRMAVTGYRDLAMLNEKEVNRLREELELALRENVLMKDNVRRAGLPAVDLFTPPRPEDLPPYTQTK